jgi:hypothetical protein
MKIVVGYDGSDAAKRALERAAALAGDDGQIAVVAAAEPHARAGITEGLILTLPRWGDGETIGGGPVTAGRGRTRCDDDRSPGRPGRRHR